MEKKSEMGEWGVKFFFRMQASFMDGSYQKHDVIFGV